MAKRDLTCKTRPVLRRCRWMAGILRDKGELPSCDKLGVKFEVSYKTVSRDIDLLRDFMGYPLVYDKTTHSWKLAGPMPEPVL
jgi:predicted DNA-binding transcriptional regulator YafY